MTAEREMKTFEMHPPEKEKGYIYFLFDEDDNLLYIGQTVCLCNRIACHKKASRIPFKKCQYFECLKSELDDLESLEIIRHNPPFNSAPPKSSEFFNLNKFKKLDPFAKGKAWQIKRIIRNKNIKNQNGYYHLTDLDIISKELRAGV